MLSYGHEWKDRLVMSKIGAYLQEHISGEVSLSRDVRESMSRDGSLLKMKPEMVVYPKGTNDIRKVARFVWQLAERGHTLPVTSRGGGSDLTGAAIGSGIVLSFPALMNTIFEYEPKQRLVRVQPGVTADTLAAALRMQGVWIPALPASSQYSTVGGAVANNASSIFSGKYGSMGMWVDRLEVVLANGDVIQTGRINKRELSKKKGLGTFEGEIYRTIDNLIEDNKELIDSIAQRNTATNTGYCQIAEVKQKDGSFDLTPLFVGSQGTLGVISEMILKAYDISSGLNVIVAAFDDAEVAQDTAEVILAKEKPALLESFDVAVFEKATLIGKSYNFLQEAGFDVETVLLIGFDDYNERHRNRHVKKTIKILDTANVWYMGAIGDEAKELLTIRDALIWTGSWDRVEFSAPSVFGMTYIPPEGVSVFRSGLKTLAKKHSIQFPLYGNELMNLYQVWPLLNLKKSGEKQKMLKMLDEYTRLVQKVGGELVGVGAEGRFLSRFALSTFDDETLQLFADIKAAFDPFKLLNPGVKELLEIKQLAPLVQSDISFPSLPNYLPRV